MGEVVFSQKNIEQKIIKIDVSEMAKGKYMLKGIFDNKYSVTEEIIRL